MAILVLRSVKGTELEFFEHDDNHRLSSLTIETVASLRLSLADFDKQLVFVQSRATNGDGFSGHFYWNAINTDPDDDQDTFQVTGTPVGRWKRIFLTESQISDLDKYTQSEVDAKDQLLQDQITINDIQIGLRETASTGTISGGGGTQINATQISIAEGDGEIVDGYTDRREPTVINIQWAAIPAFTINMPDASGIQSVYAVDDGTLTGVGTVLQKSGDLTPTERRIFAQISTVTYDNNTITSALHSGIHSNEVGNTLYDYLKFLPLAQRSKGLEILAVTSALSVFGNNGSIFSPGVTIQIKSKTDPNELDLPAIGNVTTPEPFDIHFADGTIYLSNQTVFPEVYESSPNVATSLTGNQSVIHYVFRRLDNTLEVQLGDSTYSNGVEARSSLTLDEQSHIRFTGSDFMIESAQVYLQRTASDFTDPDVAGISTLLGRRS